MKAIPPGLAHAGLILLAAFLSSAGATGQESQTDPATTVPGPTSARQPDPQLDPQQDPKPEQKRPVQVTVTAQKWGEEYLADVPRSVTAVTAEQIRDAGLRSIKDVARYVPNMIVPDFTARRLSFPFVRGVGSGQGDPAVATFVDDVPQLSLSSTNLSLVGLDRIEILRGPSGALWGRNTIGGAINMISKRPSQRAGAEASGTYGNFQSQYYDVRATGPIVEDKLAVSVSGSFENRDGYTKNRFTGNDVDTRDSAFGRAQLLWTPDEDTTVRFIVYGERTRDGGFVLSNLDDQGPLVGLRNSPFRINQDFEGETNRNILAGSLVVNHYGQDTDFVSITSAQGWDIDESADFDFSPIDGVRRYTSENEDYVYQEFRLESHADSDVTSGKAAGVKWLVGASGFSSASNRAATNEFRPGGANILFPPTNVGSDASAGSFDDWAASAFGQVSFFFGHGWEVGAALRYDYESKEANINRTFTSGPFVVPLASTQQDASFERILPRGSISYRCTDDVKTYLTAARGFKAGGFNLTAPSGSEVFGTETSWTYEFGIKSQWFDKRVTANAALFWIDWDDMQLSQFDATAGGYVVNAGKSTSRGVELELAAKATEEVTLFGTFGYLHTEFDRYIDQFGTDVAGRNLPFAPDTTFGIGGQYTHAFKDDVSAFARVDFFHVGQFFYDAGNLGGERYNLTNFRFGVGRDRWRLEGFVANAFNEEYVAIAFQANPGDPTAFVGANGAPRTYGVSLRVVF